MGLLGTSMDDPQTAGILALAGQMIRGDMGGGLLGFGQAYQGAQDSLLKRKDLTQQMQMRDLQLQQAQQEWKLQQPLLAAAVARLNGGQAPAAASGAQTLAQPGQASPLGQPAGMGAMQGVAPGAGMPMGGQPAAPRQGGSMLPGVPDDVAMWNIGAGGLKSIPALLNEYNKPTDFQKMLSAAGIDPSSAIGRQLIQGNLAKQNYIAPVNARPGSILRDPNDPSKVLAFNPQVPEGTTPQFDPNGNVSSFQPIANAEPAIALANRAKTFGKAEATPTVAYDAQGNPRFSTGALDVQRATGAMPAPQAGLQGNFTGDPAQAMEAVMGIKDPQERANAMQALSQQIRQQGNSGGNLSPQQRPGVVQGATNQQEELSKDWSALSNFNQNAQSTRSNLANITQLATKAATGPFTDKLQFTNALLGLVGSDKALDATTANALLDKNANQIVARLGAGPMGTDAARSLLQSAYPSAKMPVPAIKEAAANLDAAITAQQDKYRVLQPHATSRDPVAYAQKQMIFDTNADPRIWQWRAIQDPTQRAAYAKSIMQSDPSFPKKIQALESIGALQ